MYVYVGVCVGGGGSRRGGHVVRVLNFRPDRVVVGSVWYSHRPCRNIRSSYVNCNSH